MLRPSGDSSVTGRRLFGQGNRGKKVAEGPLTAGRTSQELFPYGLDLSPMPGCEPAKDHPSSVCHRSLEDQHP